MSEINMVIAQTLPSEFTISYLVIILGIFTISALLWSNGFKIHRMIITAGFFGVGIILGWLIGMNNGIELLLSMVIGGVLSAGIGYWFFRGWLGVFSGIIFGIIIAMLLSWQFTLPYFRMVTSERLVKIGKKQAPTTKPAKWGKNSNKSITSTYENLNKLISKLNPKGYKSIAEWEANLRSTLNAIVNEIKKTLPHFQLMCIFSLIIGLLIGIVLSVINPVFLNIAYTSLIGTIGIFGGVGILMKIGGAIGKSLYGIKPGIIIGIGGIMWIIGMAIQYYLLPEESEEQEEGEEKKEEK